MESLLEKIKTLPPLPEIVCQLTRLIDDPNSTAEDLAKVISTDQSLTARVLRLVNSSYYAFQSKISKVSHAISLMGFVATKNIVLGLSLMNVFRKSGKDRGLDHELFWEHSLGVAWTSRAVAEKSGYYSPEEAFVAGLLHDIGKVIFDMADPGAYREALQEARGEDRTLESIEKERFGFTHAELGAELAARWNLPKQLRSSIHDHHFDGAKDSLTTIVFVADILCKARGVGFSGDRFVKHVSDEIWRSFDMSKENFAKIFSDLKEEVQRTRIFLDMAQSTERELQEQVDEPTPNRPKQAILIASERAQFINLLELILEQENFRVSISEIPVKMTHNQKRDVDLILIDAENEKRKYPENIEVRIGEAATRHIPLVKIHSPFQPQELVDLCCSRLDPVKEVTT